MKRHLRDYTSLLLLAGSIIILDQWTKAIVRANLAFEQIWSPWHWLTRYARIVHWKNTGAAFGMLPGFSDVITVLAIVVSVAILYYYPKVPREQWYLRVAMGLQLGGAVGNLIDRLTRGYVTDFISVGGFPVFNIADASISIGVTILIVGMWITERKDKSSGDSTSPESVNTPAPEEFQGE